MTDKLYKVYLIKGRKPLFLPFYLFTFKVLSLFPAPASSSV